MMPRVMNFAGPSAVESLFCQSRLGSSAVAPRSALSGALRGRNGTHNLRGGVLGGSSSAEVFGAPLLSSRAIELDETATARFSQRRMKTAVASVLYDAEAKASRSIDDDRYDPEEESRHVVGGRGRLHTALPSAEEDWEDDIDDTEDGEEGDDEGEDLLDTYGLIPQLRDNLRKRGIKKLFPIQEAVLRPALERKDMIGRARTGTGKTLAFGIPIIQNMLIEDEKSGNARGHNRLPRCLVLAPTRELAKQVEREFHASAPQLSTACIYGGVSISAQETQVRRGVDMVVGTPGRLIDLISRGRLDLSQVEYVVLDEADQMLAVGFEEDVEVILEKLPEQHQTLLFSATMPTWVKKLSRKYLQDPITIDLVGNEEVKLATGISIYAVGVTLSSRRLILQDLIKVYGRGRRTIVFTATKREADEVSATLSRTMGCACLHGDIAQQQREKTLAGFRDGSFSVLVATDVAARGLDIVDVDLVVHYDLPNDSESFLHRSGRTGRAGKNGCAIALHTPKEMRILKQIERDAGARFEFRGPPSAAEVMRAAGEQAVEGITRVHPELPAYFMDSARSLLATMPPEQALASALAVLSGLKTPPTQRSLLTMEEGYTTVRLTREEKSRFGLSPGAVVGIVSSILPEGAAKLGKIKMVDSPTVRPPRVGSAWWWLFVVKTWLSLGSLWSRLFCLWIRQEEVHGDGVQC
eukprot:jgi/Mesvir1/14577/Mv05255-RA.3